MGQIVERRDLIATFVAGMTDADFARDIKTVLATRMLIQDIGEATNRLSAPFVTAHPEVPRAPIRGMRNISAHAYDIIREDVLYTTATVSIPRLRSQLAPLIAKDETHP
ncbi:MAG: HepT-like ribonuclease domain-containing protein [Chloroflexota bacterium]